MSASMIKSNVGRSAGTANPALAASPRCISSRSAFTRQRRAPPPLWRTARNPGRNVAVSGIFGLGVPELVVIAGVTALIFGPSKLPELGKTLGRTAKSFQSAAKEFESELKDAAKSDDASDSAKKLKDGQ
ncbi:TATA1 [Auxenochlorella protothecoides x Auxenochlorella symbiontica]